MSGAKPNYRDMPLLHNISLIFLRETAGGQAFLCPRRDLSVPKSTVKKALRIRGFCSKTTLHILSNFNPTPSEERRRNCHTQGVFELSPADEPAKNLVATPIMYLDIKRCVYEINSG